MRGPSKERARVCQFRATTERVQGVLDRGVPFADVAHYTRPDGSPHCTSVLMEACGPGLILAEFLDGTPRAGVSFYLQSGQTVSGEGLVLSDTAPGFLITESVLKQHWASAEAGLRARGVDPRELLARAVANLQDPGPETDPIDEEIDE